MPREPLHFDCRDPGQALRLRLRDWMWPAALALAASVPILAQSSGAYRIGSMTYYANTLGPPVFLGAILFAGLRWCWLGHLRSARPDPTRCGACDYVLVGPSRSGAPQRCPECGADTAAGNTRRPIPLMRWLLDVPGLLGVLFPLSIVAILVLAMVGVLDLD